MKQRLPAPDAGPPRAGQAREALALLAAAFLPFFFTLPPWIPGTGLVLVGWRGLALGRPLRLPGGGLRLALLAAALGLVVATFREFGGAQAGSAFLVLTSALKALESRSIRDFRLLVLLALLLVGTNFLLVQSLLFGFYAAALVWAATAIALRPGAPQARLGALLRRSAGLLLAALPVAAALFLLFPRLPGPLFRFGAPQSAAVSGLSSRLEPGSIEQLALSDAVAFRVKFEGRPPPPSQRYFRGPVFSGYDGRQWLPEPQETGGVEFIPRGPPLRYRVLERANDTRYLFAPALPLRISTPARMTPDYVLLAPKPLESDVDFSGTSYPDYTAQPVLPPAERATALALPSGDDPRTRALAKRWRQKAADPADVVQLALDWFARQPYYYTLTPPPLRGVNRIDEFLFETRSGFCEHYASAFAVLMRAAGIPARIVTGYAGGVINPFDGWLVLRQRNAHAWDEVWLDRRGWVRIDPTSVIPPARVESSARAVAATGAVGNADAYALGGGLSVRLRDLWDAANTVWIQYVVGYGPELQQRLLGRMGLRGSTPIVLALAMLGAALAGGLLAFALSLLVPARRGRDPARRLYERWCRRLARTGLIRRPYEGPLAFLARIAAARPDFYAQAEIVTALYVRARYGEDAEALSALRRQLGLRRCAPTARAREEAATDR